MDGDTLEDIYEKMQEQKKKMQEQQKNIKAKEEQLNKQINEQKKRKKKMTFTKGLISVNYLCSWSCVFYSYYLAFSEKPQIAEGLSTAIGVNIIVATSDYIIKAFLETKEEEKNKLIREGHTENVVS